MPQEPLCGVCDEEYETYEVLFSKFFIYHKGGNL